MQQGKKVRMQVYLTPDQLERLKILSSKTRVLVSVYIREAIDDLLKKYEGALKRSIK